jgi:hypothetical protein
MCLSTLRANNRIAAATSTFYMSATSRHVLPQTFIILSKSWILGEHDLARFSEICEAVLTPL